MNIRLGYRLLRDHRVPIRAKLMALGIGAACIGALEVLELPLEAVLAGILPLIGITGDIAFNGAEAIVGPVIIATMVLPYLVAPPLLRQIRAEGEWARGRDLQPLDALLITSADPIRGLRFNILDL